MGEEIEFILKKLNDAIEAAKRNDFHLAAKCFLRPKLSQQFEELKKLVEEKQADVAAATSAADRPSAAASAAAAATDSAAAAAAVSAAASAAATTNEAAVVPPPPPRIEADVLREQLYYLNNVLMEWKMITKKPLSISRESIDSLTILRQSLKKIKQDLKFDPKKGDGGKSIKSQPPFPTNVNLTTTAPEDSGEGEYRWSSRYVYEKEVHGIEDKVLSLERLLVLRRKDTDPFKAFGIHGMAGVGKTTLCQSIFSRPKVKEYFFPRIWVCMSKQKNDEQDEKKEILKRMLMRLGIDGEFVEALYEKQKIRGLVFALRLQLTGKRYLIVLDDASSSDKWFKLMDSSNEDENFGYGLPKGNGGTVIVTSRIKEVVKTMVGEEEENLRCVIPFTDKETCWKIFKDCVEKDGTPFPEDLKLLKEEIVDKCAGLPLAAKMMGEIKHKEIQQRPHSRQHEFMGNQEQVDIFS